MNLRTLLLGLLLCSAHTGFAQDQDLTPRLRRAYVLLSQAEAIIRGGAAPSQKQLEADAEALPPDRLKDTCKKLADTVDKAVSESPKKMSAEVFGYVKNSMLRIR